MLVHLLVYCLMLCSLKIGEEECSCLVKFYKLVLDKMFRIMTFSYYIRNVFQMSQFMLICAVYEVYKFKVNDITTIVSVGCSLLVIVSYCMFIGIGLYLILSSYRIDENKHKSNQLNIL